MAATAVRTDEIERLRARMQRMQRTVTGREIATHEALSGIVQLRAGGAYAVDSLTLALALAAGPSRAGEWCALVGVAELGAEAAAELGMVLDRTIVVPEPQDSWLEATAALVDVATLVVVRPPGRVPERIAEKIGARLRTRGAALVALCDQAAGHQGWPRADVQLSALEPQWSGLGRGEGHLRARRLVVEARRGTAGGGATPARRTSLWFPAEDGSLRRAAPRVAPALVLAEQAG